jgi:ribose transport system substrate-binding protein
MAAMALVLGADGGAETSARRSRFSNNYAGNSWRQSMLKSWDKVTKQAVADGSRRRATPSPPREPGDRAGAQIQNLILQGYDAIVVNCRLARCAQRRVKEAATPASSSSRSTAS